jgi:transcriptional regulator with XRE-family HTH domain
VSRVASVTLLRRLGKRIHHLRNEQDLTQEALAQKCELSQKYLSEIERGSKAPSWETLVKLSRGLDVKLSVLVFAIDEDADHDPKRLEDLLAGRSSDARYDLLQGVQLILRAGELKR